MSSPAHVRSVFKAYDVRGTVPDQIDADLARRVGSAFVEVVGGAAVVVGHDMRPSSTTLVDAFAEGVTRRGADVVRIGLCSTDQLYFASGRMGLPGVMFTASHNPAHYHGMKLCRAQAVPIGRDTGLDAIRDRVLASYEHPPAPPAVHPGTVRDQDTLDDYADHLLSLVRVPGPKDGGRRLRVVVDAGNGMAGLTAPAVLGRLAIDLVPMYFELDGTFPHHEANPIDPETLVDLIARVRSEGADVGLAFDGDADRCFLVDETGGVVNPSALTGLIADRELAKEPGATVIYNLITSRAVPDLVARQGGTAVRTRVGHSFIKQTMAETDAVFGGEHSGHFYFRDFWRADSGMLAALHALAALAETDRPLSTLLAPYSRLVASGEINSTVSDQADVLRRLESGWSGRDGVEIDHLDGLTVATEDWWFNVRPSNTEPLLRLNVEAADRETMEQVRDDALAVIRGA